ncbi:MAG: DUF1847 domain-containing protein [Syntrophorhabdales bacterium]|jgi:uncharacterized metal-binding protein
MKGKIQPDCAGCTLQGKNKACENLKGTGPKGCPTLGRKADVSKAKGEYRKEDIAEFARKASIQEGECYAGREGRPYTMHPVKPRMLEICEFARRMGYEKLGLAFCGGLAKEAAVVNEILKNYGFETISVVCKAGAVPKEEIGVRDEEKIFIGRHESMCNPILQAKLLNDAATQFNIVLGLCVGHDSLFFKYAEAPTTVLAVKDRVTGHNPLACIYTVGNYSSWVANP